MLNKAFLIIRTVKYLKIKQIIYQIYYRLKRVKSLSSYTLPYVEVLTLRPLKFTVHYQFSGIAKPVNTFNFLNIEHTFNSNIDWNYQEYGKLWNYNLQYFNYLQQNDISTQLKCNWLKDIGVQLKTGKLKLEPYPVALRVMNTIRFITNEAINDDAVNSDLLAQIAYLYDNLEFHLLGNHLLEDVFALLMGGYFFNNHIWIRKAKSILYTELQEQILNDGAHFELSPMYHQIILFRVLELYDWYSKISDGDRAFLSFVKTKASDMLGWLRNVTFSNGDIPHFNDSAKGIAFTSSDLFAFARSLGINVNDHLKPTDSGYRSYQYNKYECVVDVGEVGPSYQPGHSHADALSFVLYNDGIPFIVDAGTSTYQVGQKRSYERSTNAHNTVVIGGENQSEVWGGFRVGRRAKVKIIADDADKLVAKHDGYRHNFKADHKRSFTFTNEFIVIQDDVLGGDDLSCKALFHFNNNCDIKIESGNRVSINNTTIITFDGAVEFSFENYELANGYNNYLLAVCLNVTFARQLKSTISFL